MEKNNVTLFSISTGTMIRAVLVALAVFLLWYLKDLILVVMTSIVVASFVESAVPHFKKIGIGRVTGIVSLYTVTLLVLAGLFYLFAPLLITELYNFSIFMASYFPELSFLDYFNNEAFSGAKDVVGNLSHDFSLSNLMLVSKEFVLNLSGGFFQTFSVIFGGLVNFMLIILISFYLSIQEKGIENFLRVITPIQYENYIVNLWERSRRKIALWVKGQMLLALLITILTYLVLSLLGIQYALLLAIIAGIMELVPYGILIAIIPAVLFAYLSGGVTSSAMVAGAYLIIHEFEVFLLSPLVINKVVGLSPIIIILAALVGFELDGVWGVVLAIPVTVIIMEFFTDLEKDKVLARKNTE